MLVLMFESGNFFHDIVIPKEELHLDVHKRYFSWNLCGFVRVAFYRPAEGLTVWQGGCTRSGPNEFR